VDGQILLSQRAYVDVEPMIDAELLGAFELKGVRNQVETYCVLGFKDGAAPPARERASAPTSSA
jgi:class 3 adenylate cyclase